MSEESKIRKDTLGNFSVNILSQLFSLAKGIVVARFLGPHLFGVWNGLKLILQYTPYATLGLANAMDKQYPYYLGKGEKEKAESIKDTAFTAGMLLSLLAAGGIIIAAFFLKEKFSRQISVGLLAMALVSFLQMLYCYYRELLRLDKKIITVNTAMLLFALINCLFAVTLVMRFRLYALYGAFLCAYACTLVFIMFRSRHYFRLRIRPGLLSGLIKIGIPLTLIPFLTIVLRTLDRIMILRFLSVKELGYYSLGTLVVNLILYLPIAFQFVSYPYLLERYGKTHQVRSLGRYVIDPTILLSFVVPLMIGIVLIVIHLPINYFLSSYAPGLGAIKVIIAGSFFFSLVFLPVNLMVALGKHYRVISFQIVCIALNAFLNYLFISMGLGIKGIALGTAIAYLFLGTILIGYAARVLDKEIVLLKLLYKIYTPFVYLIGVVALLDRILAKEIISFSDDLKLTFFKLLIFALFSSPLLYYLLKKIRPKLSYGEEQ
ncbi:lipopolysaccharide biosynthesis protein [Candidatus Omnitrophota bacterium]